MFVSKYETVITEIVWNYEYETKEDFLEHKEKMLAKEGVKLELFYHSKSGKCIATFIKRTEQQEQVEGKKCAF